MFYLILLKFQLLNQVIHEVKVLAKEKNPQKIKLTNFKNTQKL